MERTSSALATLSLVSFALLVQDARGQQVDNIFFPAPREQRQRLSQAERALQERDFSQAVIALGELLSGQGEEVSEDSLQQDYFIGLGGETGTRASLKAEAQRLLGSMPDEGRKLYELRFGPPARTLLQAAVEEGSLHKLTEVTRRYFHTEAGYEATLLLGRHHMDEARPLAAALCLQRLTPWPEARKRFDPQLSLMLAACWQYAGLTEKSRQTLLSLQSRQPNAIVRAGGKDFPLFAAADDALPWLERVLGAAPMQRHTDANQWVLHRGNPQRNASIEGDLPLLNVRWRVFTINDPTEERLVTQSRRQKENQNEAPLPSLQPLAVGNTVVMRTPSDPSQVIGVDFKTGKRVWNYPWDLPGPINAPEPTDSSSQTTQIVRLNEHLWEDAPYGQLSSDGRMIFALMPIDQGTDEATRLQQTIFAGRRISVPTVQDTNRLVALDVPNEGEMRWEVGGHASPQDSELAGAYFLGAPLPLQDRLYVLAEVNHEIRLVVLDSRTGQAQWHQQLAHLENRSIQVDQLRRLAGASPSFSDGVLVCPTSAGAVVGIDISNRSLLWGYQYSQTNQARPTRRIVYNRTTPQSGKWIDATPTIADGHVILTPPESAELHCLDLATGKAKSWSPQPRGENLFVGCVHEGLLVLVGKEEVSAIRLSDGKPAWAAPLSFEGERPSGRGFLSNGEYFLPLTGRTILKIDVKQGTVNNKVQTTHEVGNLICYGDSVISHGVESLSAFYQRGPLRKEVVRRLEMNPDDLWALARHCELLLQDGKRDEALKDLRRANKLAPEDLALRSLLTQTLLELLRVDFAAHQDLLEEVAGLVERPAEQIEFATLRAIGLERSGEIEKAFSAVLDIKPSHLATSDLEQLDGDRQVRRERWVQQRVASLLTLANPQQRATIDRELTKQFELAMKGESLTELQQFATNFDAHPLAERARIELARRQVKGGDLLSAELYLSGLWDSPRPEIAAPAAALVAELLAKSQRRGPAANFYRRLAERWPDQDVFGTPGREVAAQGLQALGSGATRWPFGRVTAETLRSSRSSSYRVYPVQIDELTGEVEPGISAKADHRTGAIAINDGAGRRRQSLTLSVPRIYASHFSIGRARMVGHLMFITIGQELVAVDTLGGRDGLLWKKSLVDSAPGIVMMNNQVRPVREPNPWGVVRYVAGDSSSQIVMPAGPVSYNGACYLNSRELTCADPLTGAPLWIRQGAPPRAYLIGDSEVVLAAPRDGGVAKVYSLRDGAELGECEVPPASQVWATWGRNLLEWQNSNGRVELVLRDVWKQRELYRREFAPQSKGALVGGDEFAVLEPEGKLSVVSMKDGAAVLEQQVSPEPKLAELHVIRSQEQYLVVASEPLASTANVSLSAPSNVYAPMINGRVYAFDRQGKAIWPVAATVENYALPLDQPSELPGLLLLRNHRSRSPNRSTAQFLVLDRRDGRELYFHEANGTVSVYDFEGELEEGRMQVESNAHSFALQISSAPTPPAPPAQRGQPALTAEQLQAKQDQAVVDGIGNIFQKIFGQ